MRIGFIGSGFIANVHSWALWALRETKQFNANVTAIYDADPDRAAQLAKVNDAKVCDVDELLDSVDVVYVLTSTASHLGFVTAAADRGLPIFSEKPLAPNLADATAVAAQLERVPHQVGLVMRYAPVFRMLIDELATGKHGRIMSVNLRSDQYFPNQGQYGSTWRADVNIAGGGALIEHSIHDLDLLRWVLGETTSLTCRTANYAGHEGIEDVAVASLSYAETPVVAVLISLWHQVMSRPSTRRLEVFCENGYLWTDDDTTGPLHIESSSGDDIRSGTNPVWVNDLMVTEKVRDSLGMYAESSRTFLEAVASGKTGHPTASDALAAHRIVDACYRSARDGGAVTSL